ncbi:2fe269b7-8d28-4dee-89f9-1ac6d182217f [Thermothielavioides terrestris]|uniref:2fe269b7-8d28-4dee-89f9-1ac6d182217f n=1 Tax=Thermothielavioides terrestris TaxID=2587410 RepID=A0A3S4ANP2_9PEZI|nr:2fe269b7-8d28-4dee-89f9-1ac6d182217f [Thermothielavioides terrestris]
MEKDDFRGPHPPTTTVLLPAAGWNVAVDELRGSSPDSFVPQLELLLDALIDSLLDSPPSTTLRMHLAVQVAYLYGHCTTLKTQDYAQNLRLDHRQFHYDALSKGGIGTLPFLKEQRQIRDEIRQGVRQPQRNSWYLTPANLEKP